jgi:hypothetical protein
MILGIKVQAIKDQFTLLSNLKFISSKLALEPSSVMKNEFFVTLTETL